MKLLLSVFLCMLTNAGIAYAQLANTSHNHQSQTHACSDKNCLHQHQAASAPVVSMYNFPDSIVTDVIDVSLIPVINSPRAEVFLQQQQITPISQRASANNEEEVVMTAQQFLSTMNTLMENDPLSHIPLQAQVNTSKTVGAIPIESSISPNGGVIYNVPVACTPGRNGHQPSIGISYNSSAGNGVMGFGWSISGLSMITRAPQNYYYNGKVEPIQLNYKDVFVLDGVRLLSRNGSTTEFETERGEIRVRAVLSGTIVKFFDVSYPNGYTARFGDINNTTSRLQYPIRELKDLLGNKITFNYSFTDNQYYIDYIEYGANSVNTTNFGKITFTYLNTRPDPQFFYEKGLRIEGNKLLNNITSYSNTDVLHTYSFSYVTDRVSLLDQISCDNLNPLKFYYGYSNNNSSTLRKDVSLLESYFNWYEPVIANKAKFDAGNDNDGLIIYPNKSSVSEYVNGSKKHYFNQYNPDQELLVYPSIHEEYLVPAKQIKAGDGFIELTSAEINGVPGEELIRIQNVVANGKDRVIFNVYNPKTMLLDYSRTWDLNDRIKYNSSSEDSFWPKSYFTGDFDGDGKMEVLCVSMNAPLGLTDKKSKITLIDLYNHIKRYDAYVFDYDFYHDMIIPIDFDGDGKTDIAHLNTSGMRLYSFSVSGSTYSLNWKATYSSITSSDRSKILFGDINADGKVDIVKPPEYSSHHSQWYMIPVGSPILCNSCWIEYPILEYRSYACRNCYAPQTSKQTCIECYRPLSIYKCDESPSYGCCPEHGPGVVKEIEWYVDNGNVWTVHYGTGGSTPFIAKSQSLFNIETPVHQYILQDVNQDGSYDLIQNKNSTIKVFLSRNGMLSTSSPDLMYNSLSSSNASIITSSVNKNNYHNFLIGMYNETLSKLYTSRNEGKQRLLTGLVNSHGMIQRNYYNQLNDEFDYLNPVPYIYKRNMNASFPNEIFIGPLWVVSMRENYLNGTKKEAESYSYSNAVVNRQGLGFRGFEKVTVYDQIKDRTSEKTINPLMYGIPVKDSNAFNEVTYTASAFVASNKKLTIQVSSLKEKNLATGVTITNSFLYDTYNNVIRKTVDYGGGVKTVNDLTYYNSTSGTLYLLGQPESVTTTNTRNSTSWMDKDTLIYNTKRLLESKISYTGTNGKNKTGETRWKYDNHGNKIYEKSVPYNVTAFVGDSMAYDTQGRYVTSVWNSLGQKTTFSNYNKYGKPKTVKDFKDRITTYNYDDWGRLTSTVSPDGVTESTVFAWGGKGLYTVSQTVTGKPNVITHYDALGRELRTGNLRFDGQWQYMDTEYDTHGQVSRTSLPFKGTSATQWNSYLYDSYDRPTKLTLASGKITNWSYSGLSSTETQNGIATTRTVDASGAQVSVSDPGGTITYTLRPDGQHASITAPGGVVTSLEYDTYGRQTALVDPSAGRQTTAYSYSTAGVLTLTQTNPKGTITSVYDKYGRPTSLNRVGEFTTTYAYNTDGLLASETSTNGTSKAFTYDSYHRLSTLKETVPDSKWLQKTYAYGNGNLSSIQYSAQSGTLGTENFVYINGCNTEIKLNGTTTIWKLTAENTLGQPTASTTGSINRTYPYNSFGIPTGRTAGTIQNNTYSFDVQKGNLLSRTDLNKNKTETFSYDNLNRLTSANGNIITYAANGNITRIQGVGTMSYENSAKPYQLTMLSPEGTAVPLRNQSVSYTSYQRPSRIDENSLSASFTYNANGGRVKMYVANGTTQVLSRYYIGGRYELDTPSNTERLYLGGDAYTAPAVYVKEAGSWKLYYICRDYLGSITHIANADGTLKQELSYDAWGRLRNPSTQVAYAPGNEPSLFLGRGYTGHEHLPWFGLVNMNARLYDPALGRFLSPDPYVQMPDFTQNFNRYSYGFNNPLSYVDPSGEIVWFIPIIIGAVIGGTSGAIIGHANGAKGWDMFWYVAGGATIGGLSGGAASGVGALGGAAWWAGAAAGAVGGAGFSGLATGWDAGAMLKGAGIGALSGFLGGGLGSAIGGGWGAFSGGAASSGLSTALNGGDLGQVGISMLLGGALSYGAYELTSYIAYKDANLNINGHDVTYKQFKTMQADYQRSRFWRKEYGGILTRDGGVVKAPSQNRHSLRIDFTQGMINEANNQGGAIASYHTHWAKGGVDYYVNRTDDIVSRANAPYLVTTSNGPSPGDMNGIAPYFGGNQYLIDRNYFYTYNNTTSAHTNGFLFQYLPLYWWWFNK